MRKFFFKPNIPYFQFHLLEKFSDRIGHAVFSREGGVSKPPYDSLNVRFTIGDNEQDVLQNRQIMADAIKLQPHQIISANQTHSNHVQIIDEEFLRFNPGDHPQLHSEAKSKDTSLTQEINDIDAFVTAINSYALLIQVADCQALLLYDPYQNVIAAIHAGWKGLAKDISGETLRLMREHFNVKSENVLVGISPSLGPCCAFFTDPEDELPAGFRPFIDREKRVDLWGYSLAQLQGHGVRPEHIENARICTHCENGRRRQGLKPQFYSFRADLGITGRFGVGVWIK